VSTNSSPATPAPSHSHTNRLAAEKSPYLLQHRHNPVEWFPWGADAFAKARAENKPIFLSIGYSTCHWCHVMERESFEDTATAEVLNRSFVAIKVDREERPDVDKIYMTYVQARTGSGGWPLNVFLTPELKPFYGGTYWPPSGRQGRPGFRDVLSRIAEIWSQRREEVLESANEMTERLRQHTEEQATSTSTSTTNALPGFTALTNAASVIKEEYDPRHGGFGGAPKFPRPSQPRFLLRHAQRTRDDKAIQMVLNTCDRMAAGGMRDQLGGGFARYSVDAEWLVPHFEKMLYDNAKLVQLYLDAHLVSGEPRHADIVRSTIAYVLRDMTHPEGGFYSAEDADSEGQEGKFYCWTLAELESLLPSDEFKVAVRHFGVTAKGNFEDHSHPQPLKGLNVLSLADTRLTPAESNLLAAASKKMLAQRAKRIRPHLDDKILASWNGLMLGAVARAAVVLDEPTWLAAARKNLAFLQAKLWQPAPSSAPNPTTAAAKEIPSPSTGTLYHRWRDGERDSVQLLDAYANLLDGALHLYEATLDPGILEFCIQLADAMIARFHDRTHGGFWQSAADTGNLILRVKDDYDGAEPSGNSIAALALLRLAAITERPDFRKAAEGALRLLGERMLRTPQAVPLLLQALDFALEEPARIVIAGDPASAESRALRLAAHGVYRPNKVVLGTLGPVEPFARTLPPKENRATAYVCTGTSCKPPVQTPAELKASLR
jgi:uncharacterized protein YyaL (SSP411 family)